MLLSLEIYEVGPNTSRFKIGGFADEPNDFSKWVFNRFLTAI
jgi:hypothetical protein